MACVNSSTIDLANAQHPNVPEVNLTDTVGDAVARQHVDEAAETASKQRIITDIQAQYDSDSLPSGQTLTSAETKSTGSAARTIVDEIDAAETTRLHEQAQTLARILSQTTVNDASAYSKMVFNLTKQLADKDAAFAHWAIHNAGQEGGTVADNRLVRAKDLMERNVQGLIQTYTDWFNEVKTNHQAIADRTGHSIENIMLGAGDYRVAVHMPERNALLLARWKGERAALERNPETNRTRIDELSTLISDLETNLNSLGEHISENGVPLTSLVSGGMTNAEAAAKKAAVLKQLPGVSAEELTTIGRDIARVNERVTDQLVEAGLLTPEQRAQFPAFNDYIPVMSKFESNTGNVNDADIINPGSFHAIDGMRTPPDSGYVSSVRNAMRTAKMIGSQPLVLELSQMARVANMQQRDVGLRMIDYATYRNALAGGQGQRGTQWASNINHGLVGDVPLFDQAGNPNGVKRMLITFDRNYTDPRTGLSGAELGSALTGSVDAFRAWRPAQLVTSGFGQLNTRFNAIFAPVNGLTRDPIERIFHFQSRSYDLENGTRMNGSSLVLPYVGNMLRAGRLLYKYMHGTIDPTTPEYRMLQEYRAGGLFQSYTLGTDVTHGPRTLAEATSTLTAPRGNWVTQTLRKVPGLKGAIDAMGSVGETIMGMLNNWNEYFNNVNVFNQYLTMREAGISQRVATQGTLELLNLSKTGVMQPFLSMMHPFVRPTVQTGVAISRSLGLAPNAKGEFQPNLRGTLGLLAGVAAMSAVIPLIEDNMGKDPVTGANRLQGVSLGQLARFIPFKIGEDGTYAKLHVGFGLPQTISVLAHGMHRLQNGTISPEEVVFETLYTLGKNVSPLEFPTFSAKAQPMNFLTHLLTPSVLKPLTGTDYMGRPVTNARADGAQSLAIQGRTSTPRIYHQAARLIHQTLGFDMAPEQIRAWVEHMATGPLRIFRAVLESGDSGLKSGDQKDRGLEPYLAALGTSLLYGRAENTNRALYYQALNRYEARIRAADVKLTSRAVGSDPEKRAAAITSALTQIGFTPNEIEDYLGLQAGQTQLNSLNQKFNTDIKPVFLSSEDSGPVKEKFIELARQQDMVHTAIVSRLHMYQGIR